MNRVHLVIVWCAMATLATMRPDGGTCPASGPRASGYPAAATSAATGSCDARSLPFRIRRGGPDTAMCGSRLKGTFRLPGMPLPEPWLDCRRLRDQVAQHGQLIGAGAVKQVFAGTWLPRQLPVAVALPQRHDDGTTYLADFRHGMRMLAELTPHPRLVQLVGSCPEPAQLDTDDSSDEAGNHPHLLDGHDWTLATEYHRRGSADTLIRHLTAEPELNTPENRFRLCLDYAEIIALLHSGRAARVMCDSSTLDATLRQYLLTSDLRLLLNDVDALPAVSLSDGGVRCGPRPLYGDFVAPEQRPGLRGEPPAPYDEKTDVWKMPAVCEHFLNAGGGAAGAAPVLFRLFAVHRRCRTAEAAGRPTAAEVLEVYRQVWRELFEGEP